MRDECLINYVLPSFQKLMSLKEGVTMATINLILTCIIKLLKVEDTSHLLLTQYDLPKLLSNAISV